MRNIAFIAETKVSTKPVRALTVNPQTFINRPYQFQKQRSFVDI
jgi:hypothetical protein